MSSIISTNLSSVPFVSHTDTTRLQMSAKQLNQTCTNLRCQVPKVIGQNYRFLSDSTRLFKHTAPLPGEVLYINNELMIVRFNGEDYNIQDSIEVFETPDALDCTGIYASRLRYRRDIGPFEIGELLYEYDCFNSSIPSYGYNAMVAYCSFFGFNHEDSLVISESFAEQCRSTKTETIIIPIYVYSLFKLNKFKYFPEIGEKIEGNIVAHKIDLKSDKDIIQTLKMMNLSDFASIVDNEYQFDATPIKSKINNGIISDIRIHKVDKNLRLIDKVLQFQIDKLFNKYASKVKLEIDNISKLLNKDFANHIAAKYYVLTDPHGRKPIASLKNLAYVMEIKITGESKTNVGDKLANRYAGKGVVSLILPDELRFRTVKENIPIDVYYGSISVLSRMNFGQLVELIIAKTITNAEKRILNNPELIPEILSKISGLAAVLNRKNYSKNINDLTNLIKTNNTKKDEFLNSIKNIGLYFEAPNFANFDMDHLQNYVKETFNIEPNEDILIPRKTLIYIKDKLKLKTTIPDHDIILKQILTGPIYMLKLKQEAHARFSCRDFGSYKANSKQPRQGRNKEGEIGQSSRLGNMELDGLISHNLINTIKEFRTLKNDSNSLKQDLIVQLLTNGVYELDNNPKNESYIKLIIDSCISFLTN